MCSVCVKYNVGYSSRVYVYAHSLLWTSGTVQVCSYSLLMHIKIDLYAIQLPYILDIVSNELQAKYMQCSALFVYNKKVVNV